MMERLTGTVDGRIDHVLQVCSFAVSGFALSSTILHASS